MVQLLYRHGTLTVPSCLFNFSEKYTLTTFATKQYRIIMSNNKKLQAKELYMQTGLTKTQIAAVLGISRRNLHYWISEDHWDRLKQSAEHMPSLMAEKCYHLLNHLTNNYLQDYRTSSLKRDDIDALYRLTLTIQKLKNRTTANESMEMFALFQDGLQKRDPGLAKSVMPYIEHYLSSRTSVTAYHLTPAHFIPTGHVPPPEENLQEQKLDAADQWVWDMEAAGYIGPDPVTQSVKGFREKKKTGSKRAGIAQKSAKNAQTEKSQNTENQVVDHISPPPHDSANEQCKPL